MKKESYHCQKFFNGEHKVCSVKGCNTRHMAKGYCLKHYRSMWSRGITASAVFTKPSTVTAPPVIQDKVVSEKKIKGVFNFSPPLNPRNLSKVYKEFKGVGYYWINNEKKWIRS